MLLAKPKDLQLLKSLRDYQAQHGYSASIRDVCLMIATPSTSVAQYYLNRLEKLGLIERTPGVSRAIRVIEKYPVESSKASGDFHSQIRSPKHRIEFHSVTALGCKMRRFPRWVSVQPLPHEMKVLAGH